MKFVMNVGRCGTAGEPGSDQRLAGSQHDGTRIDGMIQSVSQVGKGILRNSGEATGWPSVPTLTLGSP